MIGTHGLLERAKERPEQEKKRAGEVEQIQILKRIRSQINIFRLPNLTVRDMVFPKMENHDEKSSLKQLYKTLITGSHILHYHNVLDAFGHLSARHPTKPDIFIMSQWIAPANISSPDDLMEFYVSTGEPAVETSKKAYAERYIHSECYKRYQGVQSVIHSHSEAVTAFSVTDVPFKPIVHVAGFLGVACPTFEISDVLREGDEPNLLVTNTHLGQALAATLGGDQVAQAPDQPLVLMRGHGFTVVAENIIDAVVRAVYAQKNAQIQTTALTMNAAYGSSPSKIRYLSEEEITATAKVMKWSAYRPWGLWSREAEEANLYNNLA